RDVESAHVKQFEGGLDFISILCAESCATQPNDVYSNDRIAFCCDDERRQIFSESRATLHHHQPSNVHVLMKRRSTAEKCAVIYADVTGQQTIIGDDDIISDFAIVADMRAC